MDNTHAVVIQELEKYASKAFNGYSYLTSDSDGTHFVITSVGHIRGRGVVNTAIIIHRDIFDKPLADALETAGVPRSQMILAYAGEPVPESV